VETTIHHNIATNIVKVVTAHQLKSSNIQIFTATTAKTTLLKENKGWLGSLGENTEIIVPTYRVIAYGISTNSINVMDQNATIQ
jgi:hypothetical protein